MAGLGQRRDGDLRDVLGVDERFTDIPGGQRENTVAQRVHEEPLAEVLIEPAGTDDGPGGVRSEDDALTTLRLFLTSTRQQHQPLDAVFGGQARELLDSRGRLGHGQIRGIGQ